MPTFSDLGESHLIVLLVLLGSPTARISGVEDVLGQVDLDAGEPDRVGLDLGRLIDNLFGQHSVPYEREGLESVSPEVGAVCDRVGVEIFKVLAIVLGYRRSHPQL